MVIKDVPIADPVTLHNSSNMESLQFLLYNGLPMPPALNFSVGCTFKPSDNLHLALDWLRSDENGKHLVDTRSGVVFPKLKPYWERIADMGPEHPQFVGDDAQFGSLAGVPLHRAHRAAGASPLPGEGDCTVRTDARTHARFALTFALYSQRTSKRFHSCLVLKLLFGLLRHQAVMQGSRGAGHSSDASLTHAGRTAVIRLSSGRRAFEPAHALGRALVDVGVCLALILFRADGAALHGGGDC